MLHAGRHGGIAARIGGWSARHKKSVLVGWLVFVVLAVVIGGAVGTKSLTQADGYTGQSGKAEQALAKSFPTPAHEETLIHSSKLTVNDPAFQAAIADVRQRVAAIPVVTHLTAATDTGAAGLVSKDRHSALVQFDIKGKIDSAGDRIGPVNAAIRAAQKQNPELRIEEFGDASVGSQIDKSVQNDLHRAETLSLPVTLIILILAFGALIAAGVPRAAGDLGRDRNHRAGRDPQPRLPDRRQHLDRDHPDRHGCGSGLLALLSEARARRTPGRS